MKKILFYLILLLMCFGFTNIYSVETTKEINNVNAANELIAILEKTHSMKANFEQFAVNKKNQQGHEQSHGKMALSRPGKFHWETLGPMKQLIVASNDLVWLYDMDLEQVTKSKVDYSQPGNPAMLLSGSSDTLNKTFNVTKLTMPGVGVWFELKPKSQNNLYQSIKLHFVDDKLIAMYMADNLGQSSEFQFENVVTNSDLDDNLFTFTPPKGVDVVEGN